MTWKLITGPVDNPPEYEVVLISDGQFVGLGFYHERDLEVMKTYGFRTDGWTIIWPSMNNEGYKFTKVTKWQKLPAP